MALTELGIVAEIEIIDLFGGENHAPAFKAKNPNGYVPLLEDGDFVLWETQAILIYLAALNPNAQLFPTGARDRADVARWQFWSLAHWTPALQPFLFENFFKNLKSLGPPDLDRLEKAAVYFHLLAKILDDRLDGREFLVGESLTLADIAASAWLVYAQEGRMPLDKYPNIARWFSTICRLRSWQEASKPWKQLSNG